MIELMKETVIMDNRFTPEENDVLEMIISKGGFEEISLETLESIVGGALKKTDICRH